MATNLNRLRKIMVSTATKETSYDSPQATDSLLKLEAGVVPQEAFETVDNQDLLGGYEEADNQILTTAAVEIPMAQPRCRPHTLAFLGTYAMGQIQTSVCGTGADKHTIQPSTETGVALDSFTTEALYKTGVQRQLSGCFVDSFGVTVNRGASRFLSVTSNILGSGTTAAGTGTSTEKSEAALDASAASVWLTNSTFTGLPTGNDLDLTVEEITSSPTNDKANMVGFDWQYRNNVDRDFLFQIGSGTTFGIAERVARDQTVTYRRLYQDHTFEEFAQKQTALVMQFKIKNAEIETGFYYGINLIFPKLKISSWTVENDAGRLVEVLTMKALQDPTYGSVILEVFNNQAAYAG